MAAFLALPWLRIGGHPVVLLDVVNSVPPPRRVGFP
jgi:hypothetical protein